MNIDLTDVGFEVWHSAPYIPKNTITNIYQPILRLNSNRVVDFLDNYKNDIRSIKLRNRYKYEYSYNTMRTILMCIAMLPNLDIFELEYVGGQYEVDKILSLVKTVLDENKNLKFVKYMAFSGKIGKNGKKILPSFPGVKYVDKSVFIDTHNELASLEWVDSVIETSGIIDTEAQHTLIANIESTHNKYFEYIKSIQFISILDKLIDYQIHRIHGHISRDVYIFGQYKPYKYRDHILLDRAKKGNDNAKKIILEQLIKHDITTFNTADTDHPVDKITTPNLIDKLRTHLINYFGPIKV
jgi:hypothetical protein